jgi:ribonuclease G
MSKEIYISSTPHETRLAIVENDELAEIYYERENEYTLAGSIYNGRVTRVLPGMQSSFVEIGLERDAFLYITDFMEEAGDSADFETTHGGGDARPARNSGDSQRRERGNGSDRLTPVTIDASVAPVLERSEEPRSDRGDRNRNGRSRRGRGDRDRGDRNGNPDRNAASDQPRNIEAPPIVPPPITTVESAELGEGAPGADGSRRWRGRRGRRRGRSGGGGQPGDVPRTDANPIAAEDTDLSEYSVEVEGQRNGGTEFLEESASELAILEVATAYPVEDVSVHPAAPREEYRNEGGRGGRNDRGGRNGRSDRGGRGDRDRGPRAPRGFAPSSNLYGVDPSAAESEAPVEPVILPGESLSKYRRHAEGEAGEAKPTSSLPPNVILAKPTTVVEDAFIATTWDGGAVLPGETLSRRTRSDASRPPRQETRRDTRHDSATHYRAESRSDLRSTTAELPQVVEDSPGLSFQPTPSTPQEQPEAALASHSDQVPAGEVAQEIFAEASVEAIPVEIEDIAATPETHAAIETEYEPQEASASYRFDPIAPSEFRQTSPFAELAIEDSVQNQIIAEIQAEVQHDEQEQQTETVIHVDHTHPFNRLDEADTELDSRSHAAFAGLAVELAAELDTTGVPPPPPPAFGHIDATDVTSISEAGEMVSEAAPHNPEPVTETLLDPTSPMLHETAVLSPLSEYPSPQHFAPGTGQLEEELIDEDEMEPATLHAGHEDEFDDLEEETLEGAADLGTMIREMSIDEITRPGDSEDDDEDFEEEEAAYVDSAQEESEDLEDEGFVEGDKPTAQSAADSEFFANTFREPGTEANPDSDAHSSTERRPRRDGRREGRRDGRDRDRNRSRSTGGESERGRSGGGQRRSMQATNLPAISDLLKPGQEILVQIAKEPIAKKGARITSHIALPGRFLVFMPTVSHTGVSRKIESDSERRRLKEILLSEKGDAAGGFIVRTAASGASEEELRSDLRFLLNLWTDIKQRSESSKSPALIYHDLNLVERILRDQVTDNFSAIWVDTESEYERVLRFLQRFQPSLIRRVKLYTKETPLFEQFGITEEINKALRSKVWLKSGGSIVINQTEALVAIDINTGKFVGKTARLEDTIVKTNLDAIPEIVRQIRLRDLGGIIIIDFIDMDERKNRNKVMAALEEELKSDRAPSKVLQFNDFGLVAITRKRVKQSLERTLSTTCGVCQGTGMTKSPITVCNDIYIEMRKMHKHLERGDVMLRVHPEVVKQLKSGTSKWLQEMEEMVGKTILVKSDPSLHPEQFDIH